MAILHGIKIMEYTEGKVSLNNPPSLWQDELILGRFLSAILATVLPQVMVCNSSHEVWPTLHQIFASGSMVSSSHPLTEIADGGEEFYVYNSIFVKKQKKLWMSWPLSNRQSHNMTLMIFFWLHPPDWEKNSNLLCNLLQLETMR